MSDANTETRKDCRLTALERRATSIERHLYEIELGLGSAAVCLEKIKAALQEMFAAGPYAQRPKE